MRDVWGWGAAIGSAAVSAAALSAQSFMANQPDHPVARSLTFWTRAAPPLFHYKFLNFWTTLTNKSDAETTAAFDALHDGYADTVHATILELRGFYIKIGQVLGTRADFLPPVWIKKMRTLEDAVVRCVSSSPFFL